MRVTMNPALALHTNEDVQALMRQWMQREVPDKEAQVLVDEATKRSGTPLNFLQFLRFAASSNSTLLKRNKNEKVRCVVEGLFSS